MAKPSPDILSWLKGHLDANSRGIKELDRLMLAHKLEDVSGHLQEASYALMRARNALEKRG